MIGKIEISAVIFIFLWAVSVWSSLGALSPGKIRSIEDYDKRFSDMLYAWFERRNEYEIVLRFIIFFTAGVITIHSFIFYTSLFSAYSQYLLAILSSASTILLLLVAELTAGTLGNLLGFKILKTSMPLIHILASSLFLPVLWLIMSIKRRFESIKGSGNGLGTVSQEDEILSLVEDDSSVSDKIEKSEREMIKGVFSLDDRFVREIMTPRIDVIALDCRANAEEAKRVFIDSGHSRLPVYEGSIDKISGVLFAKDLLDNEKIKGKTVLELSRPAVFLPENKTVIRTLEELKRTSNHFAIIIDEYGGTSGIVTLEDIIEEIVGEIGDEYDSKEDILPDSHVLPDGSVVFDGRALVSDLENLIDIRLDPIDGVDTIGGYISSFLGTIPKAGEKINLNNLLEVSILNSDKRKILKVKISRLK